jgi:hypothetical protein
VQQRSRVGRRASERAGPEGLADDGCVLEQFFLLRRQRVEPRRDQPVHGFRERKVVDRAALDEQSRELLGVERVSAGALEQRGPRLRAEELAVEQGADEASRVVVGQRGECERGRVQLAAAPAGTPLEELWSRGAEDEQRHIGRPLDEVLDEIEQALVGEMEVLEHEHERPPFAE